ncbi:MAG: ferritin-like domain-containing protein [Gemmatimonadales bacterium]
MVQDPTTKGVDEVASTLNQLIQICKDGESGFRAAASETKEANLSRLFESYAQQRAEFGAELQLEVRRLARDPVDSGHAAAALHRSWIDIKAGITGRDDGVVISEAERGEDLAVRAYRKALNTDLPADVRVLVERQFVQVQEAHDHVRSLERAHARSQ